MRQYSSYATPTSASLGPAPGSLHWHVVGGGAIGCLWAVRLAAAGEGVTLVLRDARSVERFQSQGGVIELQGTRLSCRLTVPVEAADATGPPLRQVLLAVKAHQCVQALAAIAPRLDAGTRLVTLQNGLGSIEEMRPLLGAAALAAGTTTEGAWRRAPFSVVQAGEGETWLGPYPAVRVPPAAPQLLASLQRAKAQVGWDEAVLERLWLKLAVNCVVNPLTAVLGCRNGALLEHAATRTLLARLSAEVADIVTTAGHPPPQPLSALVADVLARTAANRSSMLQDLSAGRASEVEYINGFLATTARRLGRAAPLNAALLELIRARESLGCGPPAGAE